MLKPRVWIWISGTDSRTKSNPMHKTQLATTQESQACQKPQLFLTMKEVRDCWTCRNALSPDVLDLFGRPRGQAAEALKRLPLAAGAEDPT
jgi:hypothetical protein